jgi:uncharacterized protein YndB with AHSA1/START domain
MPVKVLKWIGIVLAALVILPMITLFILGHRSGAGQSHTSIEINASPEQIWPWLEDGDKLKQWVSWTQEVRVADPQKRGVGARRVLVMKDENSGGMLISINSECTVYSPPTRMAVRLSAEEGFDGEETYNLEPVAGGHTRVTVTARFHYSNWLANLMEPLITPAAEKKMVADSTHLKSLVEGKV